MNVKRSIVTSMVFVLVLAGCASTSEDIDEFNKPALYWYKKIGTSISQGKMDRADAYYISLRSEHMRSPLMPTAMMMLAHAHMDNEKYLLSTYYLDEFNKRYRASNNREYTDYMKLQAAFLGIRDVYKDQKLIIDSISKANTYVERYPDSDYSPLVNTILIRLRMSQYLLNENIAALYDRTGKKDAAKIYRKKNVGSTLGMTDIIASIKGFMSKVFD